MEERGLPPLHNVVFMGMGEPLNNIGALRLPEMDPQNRSPEIDPSERSRARARRRGRRARGATGSVKEALDVLTDDNCFRIARNRVTVRINTTAAGPRARRAPLSARSCELRGSSAARAKRRKRAS